jgi:hypothetical protein
MGARESQAKPSHKLYCSVPMTVGEVGVGEERDSFIKIRRVKKKRKHFSSFDRRIHDIKIKPQKGIEIEKPDTDTDTDWK